MSLHDCFSAFGFATLDASLVVVAWLPVHPVGHPGTEDLGARTKRADSAHGCTGTGKSLLQKKCMVTTGGSLSAQKTWKHLGTQTTTKSPLNRHLLDDANHWILAASPGNQSPVQGTKMLYRRENRSPSLGQIQGGNFDYQYPLGTWIVHETFAHFPPS